MEWKLELKDILTLIVSGYAAVLSTYLGIREWNKNKRSLKVFLIFVDGKVHAIIVNTGYRPISIIDIQISTARFRIWDWFLVSHVNLNKVIMRSVILARHSIANIKSITDITLPLILKDGEPVIIDLDKKIVPEGHYRMKSIWFFVLLMLKERHIILEELVS